jgi:hypothetical protein
VGGLVQTLEIGDDSYTVSVVKINVPKCINTNEEIQKETFQIQLPEDLPPSYDFSLDVESKRTQIVVKYALSFTVRVIGILSDFQILKPILIATKPQKQKNDETIILKDRKPPKQLPTIESQQSSGDASLIIPSTPKQEDKTSLISKP